MDSSSYVVTESLRPHDVVEKIGVTAVLYLGFFLLVISLGIGRSVTGLFGFEVSFAGASLNPFIVVVVGSMIYGLIRRARPDTLLTIRPEGVTVRSVSVPWSSIEQIVLLRPEPSAYDSGEIEVGVRLASDAPLPDGLTSLVIDPSTPADIPTGLRTALDDHSLDSQQLVETVQATAPTGVSVVESYGTSERVLGTVSHE